MSSYRERKKAIENFVNLAVGKQVFSLLEEIFSKTFFPRRNLIIPSELLIKSSVTTPESIKCPIVLIRVSNFK